MGIDPVEGGDEGIVNNNKVPLDDVGELAEAAADTGSDSGASDIPADSGSSDSDESDDDLERAVSVYSKTAKRAFFEIRNSVLRHITLNAPLNWETEKKRFSKTTAPFIAMCIGHGYSKGLAGRSSLSDWSTDDIRERAKELKDVTIKNKDLAREFARLVERCEALIDDVEENTAGCSEAEAVEYFSQLRQIARSWATQILTWSNNAGAFCSKKYSDRKLDRHTSSCNNKNRNLRYPGDANASLSDVTGCSCILGGSN
jgi:hypothetical protein